VIPNHLTTKLRKRSGTVLETLHEPERRTPVRHGVLRLPSHPQAEREFRAPHGLRIVEAGGGNRHGVGLESLRWFIPLLISLLVFAANSIAAEPSPPNDYSAVDAIFTEHCLECHGSQDPEAKLVMESFDLLMKGGESGAVIVPGKSEESLLVRLIEGRVEKDGKKLIMPPGKKREKLKP